MKVNGEKLPIAFIVKGKPGGLIEQTEGHSQPRGLNAYACSYLGLEGHADTKRSDWWKCTQDRETTNFEREVMKFRIRGDRH